MTTIKLAPFAISPAKQVDGDIVLNCCQLEDAGHPIFSQPNPPPELENHCILKTIGVDQPFLYRAEFHHPPDNYMADCGVGIIKKVKNSHILERTTALFRVYDEKSPVSAISESDFLDFPDNSYLCIGTIYPETLSDAAILPNTLWHSGGLTVLDEEGALFFNGDTLSVANPEKMLKILSKSSAALSIGSLTTKPTKKRPVRAKKGTIIFNDLTGNFEGYDGKKWKKLSWEDV